MVNSRYLPLMHSVDHPDQGVTHLGTHILASMATRYISDLPGRRYLRKRPPAAAGCRACPALRSAAVLHCPLVLQSVHLFYFGLTLFYPGQSDSLYPVGHPSPSLSATLCWSSIECRELSGAPDRINYVVDGMMVHHHGMGQFCNRLGQEASLRKLFVP